MHVSLAAPMGALCKLGAPFRGKEHLLQVFGTVSDRFTREVREQLVDCAEAFLDLAGLQIGEVCVLNPWPHERQLVTRNSPLQPWDYVFMISNHLWACWTSKGAMTRFECQTLLYLPAHQA